MSLPYGLQNGNIVSVLVRGLYQTQTFINTFFYRYEGATVADAQPSFDDLFDKLTPFGSNETIGLLAGCMNESANINEVRFQPVYPVRFSAYPRATSIAGILNPDPRMPANVAAVISRYTRLSGRGRVGSLHITGQNQTDLASGGVWTPTHLGRLNLVAAAMVLPIPALAAASTWRPGLFKKGDPSVFEPLTVARPQSTARVMRRRTTGVGI